MITQNLSIYWDRLYQKEHPEWILKEEHPNFQNLFEFKELFSKSGRVLVPGAGYGYDAVAWAKKDYNVLAVDFSQPAYSKLLEWVKDLPNLSAIKLDIFEINPQNTQPFDIIYESGCFSALHPGRRDEYFEIWEKMLKDDGVIIAHFNNLPHANMEGPPHSSTNTELSARLDGIFDVIKKILVKSPRQFFQGEQEIWFLKKA